MDFQGSSWNSREGPWRFYINIAVSFHDVPHKAGKGLWSCAHACGRIEDLVKGACPHFDLDDKSYSTLMHTIPELIAAALAALPPILPRAHERARQGFLFRRCRCQARGTMTPSKPLQQTCQERRAPDLASRVVLGQSDASPVETELASIWTGQEVHGKLPFGGWWAVGDGE